MAEIILESLLKNLSPLVLMELGELCGVGTEIGKLSDTLKAIRSVLEDAEVKQVNDKAIEGWLSKFKDAAYDADDILDEWMTESLRTESSAIRKSFINQVHNCFTTPCFCLKRMVFRYKISKRIKEIMQKFDDIAKEMSKFNLIKGQVESVSQSIQQIRKTSSSRNEPKTYGRDLEKEEMVNLLLDDTNCQYDIFICPIVGIGGIGKTTLAQFVYNDKRVEKHFERRMWVCVAEDFNVERLTKLIIESLSREPCNLSNLDVIQSKLREMLKGKKFLLVLDDVWNENQNEWNKLRYSLTCGAKGSSIIVTTRLEKVASITSTSKVLPINSLSQDDCWELFRCYAFGMGNEENPNLAKIGYEIVQKCRGVPLAAKALGGMLRFKSEERQWKLVKDSEIWNLEKRGEEKNMILPALKLSYNNLSTCLRQCFAYCSIFPKDYEMEKSVLIQLWMANGFIQSDETMELADIGDDIFNEMMWRSLFQDVKKDENGDVTTCKMHHLLHDLASSVMGSECLIINGNNEVMKNNIPQKIRHLWLSNTEPTCQFLSSQPYLRTLFCHPRGENVNENVPFEFISYKRIPLGDIQKYLNFIFSHLEGLRVLELQWTPIQFLPSSIGKLKHLRYLHLYNSHLKSLPDSLGCLRNLQMLNLGRNLLQVLPPSIGELEQLRFLSLYYNPNLTSLPESICCLTNLRSLDLKMCDKLQRLPKNTRNLSNLKHLLNGSCDETPMGIGQLTCLETLEVFIVGPKDGHGAGIQELQGLNLLRGGLTIEHLERVSNITTSPNLMTSKEYLSSLDLSWSDSDEIDSHYEVLEALQPHPNIQNLRVHGYPGLQFPSWITTLPKNLYVRDCRRLTTLPKLNSSSLAALSIIGCDRLSSMSDGLKHLTSLEGLEIRCNDELEFSADCFDNLIALKWLVISHCPKSTTLPDGFSQNDASTLEYILVEDCGSLETLPAGLVNLTSLKKLNISRCERLRALPNLNSSLVHLSIGGCDGLSSMSEGLKHLTSLEVLEIEYNKELEFSADCFDNLVALKRLTINDCPKSTTLPDGFPQNDDSTLESLTVIYCGSLETLPAALANLTSLKELYIGYCERLTALPNLNNSLVKLSIRRCDGLSSMSKGLKYLTSLKVLEIESNKELEFPADCFENLAALKRLTIKSCPKLTTLPDGFPQDDVSTLESIIVEDCGSLETLPAGLANLTSLKELKIQTCERLTALPNLNSSLVKLSIRGCHGLSSMSEGLKYLTSLKVLEIEFNKELEFPADCFDNLVALKWLTIKSCPESTTLPDGFP